MNCLECATTEGNGSRPAVAVCHHCGAAACVDHAVRAPDHLTRVVVLNRRVPVEPAAQRIYCQTCAAAFRALSQPLTLASPNRAR